MIQAIVGAENQLVELRSALARYEGSASPAALDRAFVAAAATVAAVRGERAEDPADANEVRQLMDELPEFAQLVSRAVAEAERAALAGAAALWEWFGLRSTPPGWDEAERSGARVIVASACAPLLGRGAEWMRPRLLKLAARRWTQLLVEELSASDEDVWRRALGERYESVHRRYAPRGRWRTRGLSAVLVGDPRTTDALRTKLTRWLAESGQFDALPAEVEAAFAVTRTPARLA